MRRSVAALMAGCFLLAVPSVAQQPSSAAPPGAPGTMPPDAQGDRPPSDLLPGGPPGGPPGMPKPPPLVRQEAPRNAWGKPNFNGVWSHDFFARTDKIFYALPAFGGLPDLSMMQPWVQQRYRKHYDDMQAGKQVLITAMRCLPAGVPNVMMEAHAIQFILTPDEFIALAESDHQVRIVPIGDNLQHAKVVKPTWSGDSIARWDGDTLVIDTIGLTDKSELDPMGTPHSTQLHVVERIKFDPFGRVVVETTLTDPVALVRPWTYTFTYTKGGREAQAENVGEYACAENNRDGVITRDK